MTRPVLAVLCISLLMGGLVSAQSPYSQRQASLPSAAAESASDPGSETDALRFLLIPFLPKMPFKVDSVAGDGAVRVRVQISEQLTQDFGRSGIPPSVGAAMFSPLTEGYFLGLGGLPTSDRMMVLEEIRQGTAAIDDMWAFRAQVIRIEEAGQALVRIGPAAAEQLKQDDTFLLVRPAGSTTSQLQAAPDLISVIDGTNESSGMESRAASSLVRSMNNLKQIGLAMHNFHDTHRHFPPAVIYGPDGQPWHSWRVLLLPFLEQTELYRQYKFDEPWDGPNNRRLLGNVPSVYQDPIYGETEDAYTHYATAVGDGTGFPPEGYTLPEDNPADSWHGRGLRTRAGRRISSFRDGTSNTLLVGSVSPKRKIPWMKPDDVVFDDQFPGLGKEPGFAAPYKTRQGSGGVFVFADGSVTTIRSDISAATLSNLIRIADGNVIGEFPRLQPIRRTRSERVLVLTIPRDKPGARAKLTVEDLASKQGAATASPSARPVPTASDAASEAARQAQSANNLKRLGLGIHNYHDSYRQFPSACSTGKDGKPLLSWRVHLLPYLGEQTLYERFRLDEPWDSEHNKTLIAKMPAMFRSANEIEASGNTVYLGVTGPQGIFSGKEKLSFRDVTDGTSNTLMIVEVDDRSAVIWTRPGDFTPDSKNPRNGLSQLWSGGFHGCFADGSVRLLNKEIDRDTLRTLLTRNGGERVELPRLRQYRVAPRSSSRALPSRPVPLALPAAAAPASRRPEDALAEIKKLGGKPLAKGYKSSWSPDGTQVVFGIGTPGSTRDDAEGLGILDLGTGIETKLVSPGKDPAWSPGDGNLIAYVTGYGNSEELWVMESAGGRPRKLADGGFPTWSADGKTLFFHSRKQQKVMAIQVEAEKPELTALMDMSWWYPAISADGKQVAYRNGSQLLVADLESGAVLKTLRFPGSGRGFLGGWSTDGKRIGFGGYGGNDAVGLWLVDVETGCGERLAAGQFTMLNWSRDGSKVALDFRASQGNEIWMIDADALGKLQFEESLIDRYAVPESGVSELVKFIDTLQQFRPATPQERVDHQSKAQAALSLAAKRILRQEKDNWSEAYQTALRVMLETRIANIPGADRPRQEQTVEFVKKFLNAKLEKQIESLDVELAVLTAQTLENSRSLELAAQAYSQFADLIGKSENREFAKAVKLMRDAAKRLSDGER